MKRIVPFLFGLLLLGGCFAQHNVQVAPIQVEPIRVQMDVNVNVNEATAHDGGAPSEDERAAETSGGEAPSHDEREARRPGPSSTRDGG